MLKGASLLFILLVPHFALSQERALDAFLSDSVMSHASVSLCLLDAASGEQLMGYNPSKCLTPASVLKLITSAASLELLGPDYTFRTSVGYSGNLNKRTGRLTGDLIIKGGGDPVLGSKYFSDHYGDFINNWISEIKKAGIKSIDGRVITDDSYYDYLPIPQKWLWEDAGNYYGAGAYGLSVFDNTYEIHLRTSADSTSQFITEVVPNECRFEFSNWLIAAGTADEGYVFAAPYSTNGWLAGTIPLTKEDYILKASITDPPHLISRIVDQKLKEAGVKIKEEPTTARLQLRLITEEVNMIAETISPPLKDIIRILNNMSINFYAEHLTKELGKVFRGSGTTSSGVEVLMEFMAVNGININGMFLEDGSGLSPLDAINSEDMAHLLFKLKKDGRYFEDFFSSLPVAGKEGTLKFYFRDPVFDSRVKVKSGSMTRVKSFAGYLRTISGKDLIFCIIVNHFSGSPQVIISGIEEILKEIILNR